MITVFVWNMGADDLAGHASLQVGSSYISWWPEHNRSDVTTKLSGGTIGYGGPSFANTMKDDKAHKKRNPDYASAPIRCLDERKIVDWWEGVRPKNLSCQVTYSKQENLHYDLAHLSCATIAMRALLIGGADQVISPQVPAVSQAIKGFAVVAGGIVGGWLAEHIVGEAVAPLDVRRYAEAIANSPQNRAAG